jgi:hypothetical protein
LKSISSSGVGTADRGPSRGRRDGYRTSVVEIYIYDEFATSFQRSRAILGIWTTRAGRWAPAL